MQISIKLFSEQELELSDVLAEAEHRGANRRLGRIAERREIAAIAVLAVIVAYAIAYSVIFVGGPSFYGDDTTYLGLAADAAFYPAPGIGPFIESSYIFSVRILQILPIALFYKLFGVSMLSSSAWDIIAFVGTVIVSYLLGRKLHSMTAGLISAFLISFFPLVVILAPTISDDVTMMFVASLAMLCLLYAVSGNSRKWYFAAGFLLVASPLVTPEGAIIIVVAFLYLFVELLRRKIRIDGKPLYLPYGILLAGALLIAYNYINSGHMFITLTTNSNFYSAVGGKTHIPSTNTDPCFYIDTMFPYNLLFYQAPVPPGSSQYTTCIHVVPGAIVVAIERMSPQILIQTLSSNSNQVGLYFYAFLIALVYLIVKRERRAYFVVFWFVVAFLYLEFGPMHFSLIPVKYLLSYRLQRFLTTIAVPTVVTIGIASTRSFERLSLRGYIGMAIVALGVLLLVVTSIMINMYWYNSLVYSRYDQLAIARYLSALPPTTKIYFASAFSNVPIYMKFEDLSRFYAYDGIDDCHEIPNASYVIIPKYNVFMGLNYTPNPLLQCPNWQLVLYPNITKATGVSYPASIMGIGEAFGAKLYYVPGAQSASATNATNSTVQPTTTIPPQYNYYNLTGVGVLKNGTVTDFAVVNNVRNVSVELNRTSAQPGEMVRLNVTFEGNFLWNGGYGPTIYYFGSPLINVHYYGVELSNQGGMLYDQNNGPWYYYVNQSGEPHQIFYTNESRYLRTSWNITPTENVVGEELKICGGYFATYKNTTLGGGWGDLYDNLSLRQIDVVNNSVINLQSSDCAYLKVT